MQTDKTFEGMEARNRRITDWSERVNTDDFQRKIVKTKKFIKECLDASAKPVLMCSFGKDSLVMLHLVNSIKKVPVIYWREPFYQKKYSYPQMMAEKMDLTVYDYPPYHVDYLIDGEYKEVYNFYHLGGIPMVLYTGCCKPKDDNYLCAVRDLLLRPKCTGYEFNWDLVFHGHKQTDPLYVCDNKQLPKVKVIPSGLLTLPILDWTDDEIWAYIDLNNVEYNKDRYDSINQDSNNDMFPTCFDCLEKSDGKMFCKKLGREIEYCGKTKEANQELKSFLTDASYK